MNESTYRTAGGIVVHRQVKTVPVEDAVEGLVDALDERRGALFSSSYEYPGRYTRWDMGFTDPLLAFTGAARQFRVEALNDRGAVLLPAVRAALAVVEGVLLGATGPDAVVGEVEAPTRRFEEEERSRQPSLFSVLRAMQGLFASPRDSHLGLYGAFGYDLAFQFEPIQLHLTRPEDQRDLVLYLPDELIVVDHQRQVATHTTYEFSVGAASTAGLARSVTTQPYRGDLLVERTSDHAATEYAALVDIAKNAFRRGDLFEVVPGQMFTDPCPSPPSELFRRLRERNPSPYGFLINLGNAEYLVGASPEMYVRVDEDRVETCPISGTIARGGDPISDAQQILTLLNSEKDTSELTMCTDVDRNDKSRICRPGSVQVIGRRQIEMYSRLIHTVDHVEGRLKEGFDSLDAFLTHTWAVTVTGAPKADAMQWIEAHERSPRAWYGGAVGVINFNGNLNTGLTLRTIRILNGQAQVRVGATLLFDSDPLEEEAETELKASAFLDVIREPVARGRSAGGTSVRVVKERRPVVLVDHRDSFVHTLANYFRQAGADVRTLRAGTFDPAELAEDIADLVVLSPGPGRPEEFAMQGTIRATLGAGKALFGVCLGLQGLVEYHGGTLGVLALPMHGKPSVVRAESSRLFDGLPPEFTAGRYHSLFADPATFPTVLRATAHATDGVIMAIEHPELAVAGVQFHPESIMSLGEGVGMGLIANVVDRLR